MTVKISKPAINVREELADLRKPTGIAGEAMLRAETPQEQFNLIGAGRRNLIINGDMRIAQRGTSFTSSGSGLFTLDRWVSGVHTGTGDGNMTQETDAPTAIQSGTAFTHSLKFQVTTANTNIQATDRKYHVYRIEGQDLAPAGFGQAGQRYMTLSFWHKHTKTGTHSLAINNAARNRSYPMEYTQATTNTWEKAELTFPVDTTGTWLGGNGIGMWIFFGAAFGSNYAGTVNQWGSSQKYGTANQVNNYDSTSNSMQFTGVQLEVGDTATPFEHRSYGEELAKCQRYYWEAVAPSQGTLGRMSYIASSTSGLELLPMYPVPMRATPSVSLTNPTGGWQAYRFSGAGGGHSMQGALGGSNLSSFSGGHMWWDINSGTPFTVGFTGRVAAISSSGAFKFDAEL
jgi:hypothetical protein